MKILATTTIIMLIAFWPAAAPADTFRIHYTLRGSGRDITIQADSTQEARQFIRDAVPGAMVTSVHRIKKG
jgi:hypothetical protein